MTPTTADCLAAVRGLLRAEGAPRAAAWLASRLGRLSGSQYRRIICGLIQDGHLVAREVPSRRYVAGRLDTGARPVQALALPEDDTPDWDAATSHYIDSLIRDRAATLAALESLRAAAPPPSPPQPIPAPTPPPRRRGDPAALTAGRQAKRDQARQVIGQAVRDLLAHGPLTGQALHSALVRRGLRVSPNTLRLRLADRDPSLSGVRYLSRAGYYSLAYLPQHEAQALALAAKLGSIAPAHARTIPTPAPTPKPAPRFDDDLDDPDDDLDDLDDDAPPLPDDDLDDLDDDAPPLPDDDLDDLDDDAPQAPTIPAHLDPRRGAVPIPQTSRPPVAAVRAAVARLAKRLPACGLTWTIQPIPGLCAAWEIVESVRDDDHRLMGEDVCRRRLERWHREGSCPPRTDGLTPPTFAPTPPRKEIRP
jgi:hypothetical protein